MLTFDIPPVVWYKRIQVLLLDLLQRAAGDARASWIDLPNQASAYVVRWIQSGPPAFLPHHGRAIYAECVSPKLLEGRWQQTCIACPTDTLYVGKGESIKQRVRFLARVGVGKAENHGGEWFWQVQGTKTTRLLIQTCPSGEERALSALCLSVSNTHTGYSPWPTVLGRKDPIAGIPFRSTDLATS
ncbi:MAG: hypothetical protein IT318_14885 [Anaerolineales bacterium]|nr:hypothetical protein [Anaerolineales bacterium]